LSAFAAMKIPPMSHLPDNSQSPTNLDLQALTDETVKLLQMNRDTLFTTLGGQLLGTVAPSRVAGIASLLAAVRAASDASVLLAKLQRPLSFQELSNSLGVISEELMREGSHYVTENAKDLREALNNEDILRLSDETSRSHIQVILIVVSAVLRLPRNLDTIAATVTAILLKQGLRHFCGEKTEL
jgi:hypothetical protein